MTAYDHPARPELRAVELFRRSAAAARMAVARLEHLDLPDRDSPAWVDLESAHDLIEDLIDRIPPAAPARPSQRKKREAATP